MKRVDKEGRCAALEIMLATSAVRNMIRDSKTFHIPDALQMGKKFGMQTLDDAIMKYLNDGWIDPKDAYNQCIDKAKFRQYLTEEPDDFADI